MLRNLSAKKPLRNVHLPNGPNTSKLIVMVVIVRMAIIRNLHLPLRNLHLPLRNLYLPLRNLYLPLRNLALNMN